MKAYNIYFEDRNPNEVDMFRVEVGDIEMLITTLLLEKKFQGRFVRRVQEIEVKHT
jgi:hypothetical protein